MINYRIQLYFAKSSVIDNGAVRDVGNLPSNRGADQTSPSIYNCVSCPSREEQSGAGGNMIQSFRTGSSSLLENN
jgi:hypothetical protein